MIAQSDPRSPAEHLLVLDIGNSSTSVGVWSANDIRASTTISDSEFESIGKVIEDHWQAMDDSKCVVACSVVPNRLKRLKSVVAGATETELLVVGESLPLPLEIKITEPKSIGTDRLCCAAAAYLVEGQACAVADMGTAITVDCVDDSGCFIGGAILPGLHMQARALAERAVALPQVSIECPADPLGQRTEHAIQSGIIYGSIGAIKELVERFATKLGRWPVVLLTGGDAAVIAGAADYVDKIVPHLCLRGAVLAYEKSFEKRS